MPLGERFRYSGGEEMNGFFISHRLTESELDICFHLVSVGPLGLGIENIKKIDDGIYRVTALVEDGLIQETTLLELATKLTQDEWFSNRMHDWRAQGGLGNLEREGDKNLFSGFEQAEEIIRGENTSTSSETRYQVMYNFYRYIDLIYDDR